MPTGKVKATYFDSTAGISRADADKMPKRRIDCIDCHNAAGHPFSNPANLVDDALEEGRIDRSLPSIKARSDAIIQKASAISGPEAERAAKFAELIAAAAPQGEQKPTIKEAEQKFAAEMKRILLLSSFAAKDLTWKTFPNNVGHKDFPGCFRCHDGKHMNDKGEAIRLQCTLCHALPKVASDKGMLTVQSTVSPDLTPPSSHEEPNWMHDHRSQMDSSCAMCHGKIQWGTDGGSFCSNPACHGRKWPEMNLDARAARRRMPRSLQRQPSQAPPRRPSPTNRTRPRARSGRSSQQVSREKARPPSAACACRCRERRCRSHSLSRRSLGEFALERAAVHGKRARGLGNIALVLPQHALDVLPLQPVDRHRLAIYGTSSSPAWRLSATTI